MADQSKSSLAARLGRRRLVAHAHRVLSKVVFNEPGRQLATRYLRRWWVEEVRRVWNHPAGPPEWYDHRSHLASFSTDREPMWAERGVYSREPIRDGDRVLDLCCGDGFYSFHFFSDRAGHVDAIDFDPSAIEHARKHHQASNVDFQVHDIRTDELPAEQYDVVVWDGAIEHFTEGEIDEILGRLAKALEPHGVLTGYTMRREEGGAQHPEHEHEFEDADELRATLLRTFPHAAVLENTSGGRRNMYFRAAFTTDRLSEFR